MVLEKQKLFSPIAISVALHLLVFAFLLFTTVDIATPTVTEFVEIIFLDTLTLQVPTPAVVRQPAITPPVPQIEQPAATPPQVIDIPVVVTPDFEPLIDVSLLPTRIDDSVAGTDRRALVPDSPGVTAPIISDATTTLAPTPVDVPSIAIEGFTEEIRGQTGSIADPLLTGDVINRTVLHRVLPDFPEGVTRTGTVTLAFRVAGNGNVQNIRIIRRGEPEFERVTTEALRQWRFNRDPQNRSHDGQITFEFRLV
jgi:TonB family protein